MKSNQRKFAVLILMAFAFNAALAQLQSVAQSQHPKIVKGSFGFNVSQNKISKENFASKKLNEYFSLNEKHSFKLLLQTPAGESPTGKTSTSKTLAGKTTYEDSKQETPDKLETPDELGFTHSNYQQLYNGYPIYGQLVMLHCKDGIVRSINGQIAEFDTLDLQINISDTRAVSIAKAYLNVTELAKEYPVETLITKIPCSTEPQYRLTKKVHMESHSPFLMYDVFVDAKTGDVLNKISLFAGAAAGTAKTLYNGIQNITCSLDSGVYYLIDEERKIATADATAEPKYYQSNSSTWKGVPLLKSIKISSISEDWWHTFIIDESPDLYIIIKDGSGKVVHTTTNYSDVFPPLTFSNINLLITNPPYKLELWDYDPAGGDDYAGSYTFSGYVGTYNLSGNSNFTAGYSAVDSGHAAYDVHWGIEKTYDFYKNTFNRNSYDGNGGAILSLVNPVYANGSNGFPNNAAAQLVEPYSMMFGMGDGKICNPVVGLDVAAHEFSHLVIANNGVGGLIYQGESGALNESFADIFGTCVEFYSKPAYANWDIGEDVIIKYSNLRSVSNPNNSKGNTQQPDTYKGHFWKNPVDTNNDNGGVHINSGVQNFWFYLLCQGSTRGAGSKGNTGGTGSAGNTDTNDLGNSYSVSGIGMAKAQQIAYRNLTTYLSPSSTYYDACIGSLLATEDLYGNPSAEYTAVEQAWYAVGVTNGASEIINCKDSRVENFNKLNAKTNNTYGDGSFTGNNGIVWNYVHCSDASGSANYPINGKSLLLRSTNDGSKLFSNAIEGGIKNFSVKFRKAFKSPAKRQLELYINGELKGASQMIGNSSDEDPAIYCFEVENINVSGSFVMEIRLASTTTNNAQIAIDDICWCPYDASGDASLKSIELSAGVLQPEFNSDTTDYSVNVENNIVDISVTGTLASSSATLIGNVTNKELNVGSNIVNILVTAQNGVTQKNYTVNVIRAPIVVSNDLAPITSDKKAMALRAYPNPAGEEITLQPTVAGSDIYIYNSLGLRVACHKASAEQSRIDIRNLPAGIYLIKLDGETVKVIKR